jgi:assimilatory nitrate reductase catalytic subunit
MSTETTLTRSTCPYCGVGCGVLIASDGARITGVQGDPEHPANFGKLCTKGASLHLTAEASLVPHTRLLRPQWRSERGAAPKSQDPAHDLPWSDMLPRLAQRFADIIAAHGTESVGFYISGQLLTEDYYVFNKLVKGLIGSNHIDTNSRLCMSSAVAGYKQTLGADAPPCSYGDLDVADCIFITGSNTADAHPILFRRIEAAKAARPGMKLIVADPRRTATAELADLHLPLQPGSDVALYHGLLHIMLWEGWVDTAFVKNHTTGFEALKSLVREFTPERVAQRCGIPRADVFKAAEWFAQAKASLSLYCQGLNQSSNGTGKNAALINLHLATGHIGKPGAGPFSLTGQPNAMGGREVGGMANLLSAHRDLGNAEHRAEVATLWGVDDVPATPGLTAVEMFEALHSGRLKAVWIACTNPLQSMPNATHVREALQKAELVVLQEAFVNTETAAWAHVLLPATTWGEKEGTVTNSERRISRVRAAVPPPKTQVAEGEQHAPRHDWRIAAEFAQALQTELARRGLLRSDRQRLNFAYPNAEAVWNEHRESTRGRDLDITGLSYAILEQGGPQQWPMPEGVSAGTARLYTDHRFATPDGLARFVAVPDKPTADNVSARYPFALSTGRLREHWHGMSRTGLLGRAFAQVSEPALEMNPQDMLRRRVAEGAWVRVSSARGSVVLPVRAEARVGLGQCFLPMHWGGLWLGGAGSAGVNTLTNPAFCPSSKQPELKHSAVRIEPVASPWQLYAGAWLPSSADAQQALHALQALLPQFEAALCAPFADAKPLAQATEQQHGVMLRAAGEGPVDERLLQELEAILGVGAGQGLRYVDQKKGERPAQWRNVALDARGAIRAVLLAGDAQAQAWLRPYLLAQQHVTGGARSCLQASAKAPGPVQASSPVVCNCMNVTQAQIAQALQHMPLSDATDPASRLHALQTQLSCGTQCGSCLPDVKRWVAEVLPPLKAAV